jgi:hypothetical protein
MLQVTMGRADFPEHVAAFAHVGRIVKSTPFIAPSLYGCNCGIAYPGVLFSERVGLLDQRAEGSR